MVHAGFRGLCVTTTFVVVSLLTEVEDPQRARELIESARPQADGEEERATDDAAPADD